MTARRTVAVEGIGEVLLEKSRRARRLSLTVVPEGRIRVAVPWRVSFSQAEAFLRQKRAWLEQALRRIQAQRGSQEELAVRFRDLDIPAAKRALARRLRELAAAYGYKYTRVIFRRQKTRWGSCSVKGTISLNLKLAVLPDGLRDYVLLHELAHTKHHHHGPAFWEEMERLVKGARQQARRLRGYDLRLI